jgi:Phenylalanyl tRNA synthetase beta chain CLM domain
MQYQEDIVVNDDEIHMFNALAGRASEIALPAEDFIVDMQLTYSQGLSAIGYLSAKGLAEPVEIGLEEKCMLRKLGQEYEGAVLPVKSLGQHFVARETLFQDEHKVAHSRWKMGILLVGTDHPFNNAHTLLDALCYHLHLDYTLKRSSSPALIPGRQMTITAAETPIGQFGEVHPEVLTRWELFYPASFIELDLDTVTEMWVGTKSGA